MNGDRLVSRLAIVAVQATWDQGAQGNILLGIVRDSHVHHISQYKTN